MENSNKNNMSATRRRTDKAIRTSFVEILQNKPLDKITVQDICNAAEINRATFYRYYVDIYDLFDTISQMFFDKLFTDVVAGRKENYEKHLSDEQLNNDMYARICRAVDVIEEEKDLCFLLINSSNHIFAMKLVHAIEQITITENISDDNLRLNLRFMCGGIFSVIIDWVSNNCKDDKDLIINVINRGVHQTLNL
ncbi:MAG: TetR/AcrR family transcriptional regulator [Lachnospiraceae bacterium]|nr:TetR/AcrR family transcriptional regulator [Lachnospiraceae bacterium]